MGIDLWRVLGNFALAAQVAQVIASGVTPGLFVGKHISSYAVSASPSPVAGSN